MLSDGIKEMRVLFAASEGASVELQPDTVAALGRILQAWAIEAGNMEARLAAFGPHQPIVEVSLGALATIRRLR